MTQKERAYFIEHVSQSLLNFCLLNNVLVIIPLAKTPCWELRCLF